jgi:hypothetical protein
VVTAAGYKLADMQGKDIVSLKKQIGFVYKWVSASKAVENYFQRMLFF